MERRQTEYRKFRGSNPEEGKPEALRFESLGLRSLGGLSLGLRSLGGLSLGLIILRP